MDVAGALTEVAREQSGRVLALLARQFSDLDLADDSVQDALTEAATDWPRSGVPDNPGGWLYTVAKRKAIDRLRRRTSAYRRTLAAGPELLLRPADPETQELMVDESELGDEHLRLVLLCCHPALDSDTQVALTLRLVAGLTTPEIAAAYLIPPATLAQRIVRAKRKIRDAGIPLSIPARLDERVSVLLGVLYLIFNEGYLTRGDHANLVRIDLAEQAIRLTRLVGELVPDNAEVQGLLALELFHRARFDTRTDALGDLVLLAHQDRTRWDAVMIQDGNSVLTGAMRLMTPGPFQMQALIAAYHANARTVEDTDWTAIVAAYQQLSAMDPSPVIALNHAVAAAMADGPRVGLTMLDRIVGLDRYHLFHAARGELLLRDGDNPAAAVAFGLARELTENPAERRHLDRRLAAC